MSRRLGWGYICTHTVFEEAVFVFMNGVLSDYDATGIVRDDTQRCKCGIMI